MRISNSSAWAYGVVCVSALITAVSAVAASPPQPDAAAASSAGSSLMSDAADATAERVARILARPLFTLGRQPTPNTAPAQYKLVPPRLTGIIGTPDHLNAIFETALLAQANIVVTQGMELDGWTVRSIAAHSVTLAHDGKMLVISPTSAAASNPVETAVDARTREKIPDGPPSAWQVGQRRNWPLPTYLQRRP